MDVWFEFGHLVSYSFWFGAQTWLLGVQAFVLRATVTRHQFGHIMSKVFPVFFKVGSTSALISIGFFACAHPSFLTWSPTEQLQCALLTGTLAATLINQLWLGPKLARLMLEYHMIEKEEGLGDEIKTADLQALATNKKYQQVKKSFLQFHFLSVGALITSISCMLIHGFLLCRQRL